MNKVYLIDDTFENLTVIKPSEFLSDEELDDIYKQATQDVIDLYIMEDDNCRYY
jgi:hypothetical protein